MIGHRVLVKQGVYDALHGANARLMSKLRKAGWQITTTQLAVAVNSARDMLEAIANARKQGKPIKFVWLDPQNPDRYNTIDPKLRYGSILGLRDLAREILEPVGVRVLLRLLYSDNDGACIPDHQR